MKYTDLRSRHLPIVACAAAALGCALPAAAAPGPALPIVGNPSSISAGVFIPSSGEAKDKGGATQLSVNFRYTLPVPDPIGVPVRTVLDLGVETGAKSGGHSTVIPLTAGVVAGTGGSSPYAPGSFFYGAGAGAYFINQSSISSATRLGGYVELGYSITGPLYVNAKYQFVDHANGAAVNVGLRF
ncbi:hypothetical protein CCAX7_15660 [Capsulimonas corticalis]|uniref:Uncharacterized protein n=1 Tax=Capsulimonas corticalis TaxID=2219043 RepID=A0A402CZ54_9BACT|nr:hypothetical protein [Capsulimonas corticalis]BDI29515.1 hypothetical protein CCAX7_15660 [Capsulimonas corticalis]